MTTTLKRLLRAPVATAKRIASGLPQIWQQELKRLHYRGQIRRGTFETAEPEFAQLDTLLSPGDWVIDIGANIGHYTKRFSELVGPTGRVIAIEPVPETFALLAANVSLFRHRNVSLFNIAASDRTSIVGIQVPRFETGLNNYYEAAITSGECDLKVMTSALDGLRVSHPVRLVKIDAEGHDPLVLQGLAELLVRDHPTIIIESGSQPAAEQLERLGYRREKLPGSPNTVWRHNAR